MYQLQSVQTDKMETTWPQNLLSSAVSPTAGLGQPSVLLPLELHHFHKNQEAKVTWKSIHIGYKLPQLANPSVSKSLRKYWII